VRAVLVTIGLPFYKDGKTLLDAIRSVFAQTFSDWELILVDDGSADGSLEIARSINDSRVRVISDGINKGLACRLNQIAQLAQGKYIARMDADDLMHSERLERQVRFLEENPNVDVVGTGSYSIDLSGRPIGIRESRPVDSTNYAVLKNSVFIHPSITGRTEWFRENPYDESEDFRRAEDYELWCRTFQSSCFANLEEPLFFYREANSISISIKNYLQTFISVLRVIKKYGPAKIGLMYTSFLLFSNLCKIGIYYSMWIINKQELLISRRYRRLSGPELQYAATVLANISKAFVPCIRD
jgi:glycosyltransferase involved in cell wall biosynthesis